MYSPAFQRAFVAFSYFVGRRNQALLEPLAEPAAEASALVERLSHPDRARRAEALAGELARVYAELERRSYR
jgi:hypothetical protein